MTIDLAAIERHKDCPIDECVVADSRPVGSKEWHDLYAECAELDRTRKQWLPELLRLAKIGEAAELEERKRGISFSALMDRVIDLDGYQICECGRLFHPDDDGVEQLRYDDGDPTSDQNACPKCVAEADPATEAPDERA
jgi:hypothetical protein